VKRLVINVYTIVNYIPMAFAIYKSDKCSCFINIKRIVTFNEKDMHNMYYYNVLHIKENAL
jgi:hypothetical protein